MKAIIYDKKNSHNTLVFRASATITWKITATIAKEYSLQRR